MTRRIATLKIAHELLPDLLHLPPGTKVVDVMNVGDLLNVTVTHGHLKEIADGAEVPTTSAIFTSVPQAPVTRFDGWGAQDDGKPANEAPTLFTPAPAVTPPKPTPAPVVTIPRITSHDGPGVTAAPPTPAPVVTGH